MQIGNIHEIPNYYSATLAIKLILLVEQDLLKEMFELNRELTARVLDQKRKSLSSP